MKNVCIIGAGNIGSRHLQGLKKINSPLSIEVVDPSINSLKIAKERFNQIQSSTHHKISFLKDVDNLSKKIDLAIIATSSNVRRKVVEDLLGKSNVKYLILEKILFQKREDYKEIEKLLEKKKIKTWVNFSMRTMSFYRDLKTKIKGKVQMIVSGSRYGLITNAVHFVDYIAYLTNKHGFIIDSTCLDKKPIESKRQGFLELNGTLSVYFKDGSSGSFTCYSAGDAPFIIEILSKDYRVISKESERKAYLSSSKTAWKWVETDSNIPFQSDMTNLIVEEILKNGKCNLASYSQASALHTIFLEGLLEFINKSTDKKFDYYPFT